MRVSCLELDGIVKDLQTNQWPQLRMFKWIFLTRDHECFNIWKRDSMSVLYFTKAVQTSLALLLATTCSSNGDETEEMKEMSGQFPRVCSNKTKSFKGDIATIYRYIGSNKTGCFNRYWGQLADIFVGMKKLMLVGKPGHHWPCWWP